MKTNSEDLGDGSPSRRTALVLFSIALGFWPAFTLLTILEEKAGLTWLETENPKIWAPIAALALLSAIIAPLVLNWSVPKKIIASISALAGFLVIYGLMVLIGASYLNWVD